MEQVLKDFLENDEALDAIITSGVVYLSTKDVDKLLKKNKEQLLNSWLRYKRDNWYESESVDVEKMLIEKFILLNGCTPNTNNIIDNCDNKFHNADILNYGYCTSCLRKKTIN